MMNGDHAFLILAHKRPVQLQSLIDALTYPPFDIYVHIDRTSDFPRMKGATTYSEFDVSWAGYKMIEATALLLRKALPGGYDTYTLLSGTDYPIKPNEHIHEVLEQTTSSRVDYWHDDNPNWHRRYKRFFFYDLPSPVDRILNGISRRLARFLPDRTPPYKPYFGSQWWTLTHDDAERVVSFADEHPAAMRFMRHVHIPDEMFVQTALTQQGVYPEKDPLRYIDWSDEHKHPKKLGFADLEALAESKALFARKFDPEETPGILSAVEELRQSVPVA